MLASKLIGTTVVSQDNETIGDVNDVLFDRGGQVMAAVIGVGGFLGIGEKDVAVPFQQLEFVANTADAPASTTPLRPHHARPPRRHPLPRIDDGHHRSTTTATAARRDADAEPRHAEDDEGRPPGRADVRGVRSRRPPPLPPADDDHQPRLRASRAGQRWRHEQVRVCSRADDGADRQPTSGATHEAGAVLDRPRRTCPEGKTGFLRAWCRPRRPDAS